MSARTWVERRCERALVDCGDTHSPLSNLNQLGSILNAPPTPLAVPPLTIGHHALIAVLDS